MGYSRRESASIGSPSGASNDVPLQTSYNRGMRRCLLLLLFWCLAFTGLHADSPAFDLTGPKVDVHVKRGEVTLPIGETPNLLPGDRLWIHPDLPESQSTHFVLIVAFLRGATNPPPPEWFTRVETWTRVARSEGVFVTVPAEAQQALIFLAPETGGDFSTLRAAVRGRPGVCEPPKICRLPVGTGCVSMPIWPRSRSPRRPTLSL